VGALVDNVDMARGIISTHAEKEHVDWHLHPCHKWKLVPAVKDMAPDAELERINAMFEQHENEFSVQKETFDEYCEEKRELRVQEDGPGGQQEILEREKQPKKSFASESREGALAPMSSQQMPSQRFAAVGIINPPDTDDCMFNVFAAFDLEADAVRYVQDTLAGAHKTIHLHVVAMYAWIFPDVLYTESVAQIPTSFRHEHIHNIMDYKRQLPARIQAYEEHCQSLGIEPKFTDVTGNAEDVSVPSATYAAPAVEEAPPDEEGGGVPDVQVEGVPDVPVEGGGERS
jgi:hypothetical protein